MTAPPTSSRSSCAAHECCGGPPCPSLSRAPPERWRVAGLEGMRHRTARRSALARLRGGAGGAGGPPQRPPDLPVRPLGHRHRPGGRALHQHRAGRAPRAPPFVTDSGLAPAPGRGRRDALVRWGLLALVVAGFASPSATAGARYGRASASVSPSTLSCLGAWSPSGWSVPGTPGTRRDRPGRPVPRRSSAEIFFVGQLGKYVPGAVWPVVVQMRLGRASA